MPKPRLGAVVYSTVALGAVTLLAVAFWFFRLDVGSAAGGILVLLGMWIPYGARLVATRTVDRGWSPPLPLRQWGRPRIGVVAVPLLAVFLIYGAAYALAAVLGFERGAPTWHGAQQIAANLALNVPLLMLFGLFGSLGEELGWRGYLQPRLDQAGVRASLLIVIAVEWLFHIPFILFAGYTLSSSVALSVALFLGLKLGATPLWTFYTYRLRSIWVACLFHSIHNGVSQTIMPKLLGAGDELILQETGVLPVAVYLLVSGAVFAVLWMRRGSWREVAKGAVGAGP